MADWSQLPPELVVLIAKRLEAGFDVLRFRSVCSSWRSSVPPRLDPHLLPIYLPYSRRLSSYHHRRIHITRNTFYLIRLSHGNKAQAPACWFVKIRDRTDGVKMQLLDPFSDYNPKPLPENFPKVLDLSNVQVLELGHEYIGQYKALIDHPSAHIYRDYRKKVVLLRSNSDSNDFMILTFFQCLAVRRSGEEEWVMLENVKDISDIISFNGKFYAIDYEGRTTVIDQSLNVSFLQQHAGTSRSRKFLVKSVDDLLAVERLLNPVVHSSGGPMSNCSGFRVFRMNEEEQKWDEMKSLRDRILFLGYRQAISAPASEFCSGKGNLVFYLKGFSACGLMRVFDLETGTASPLENWPAYCDLFWPSPQWVNSAESVISSAQVSSNSTHPITSAGREAGTPSSKCSFTRTH
ncbi:hypothetical protein V6N13_105877 [Hibiscus sabdariffa]|uniref:F-box domain-containing protein n=1 Tax=Hibiscus sabdariffa TaxID=183260 RepID=A0ABR2EYZ8_9ROSI